MLERFLVPLDTSDVSEQVLPYVALLAKQLGQPVHLVSVVADEGELTPAAGRHAATLASLVQHRRDYAQRYLDSVRDRLEAQGISVTAEVAIGRVPDQILAAVAARRAELVAMATHGRSGLERWFVGSVTDRIARTAPVPVLVVRPHGDASAPSPSISQILLPLDGSELAEAAVTYATFLARSFKAPVIAIRTLELAWLTGGSSAYGTNGGLSPELLDALENDAKVYLEEISSRLRADGIEVRTVFALRSPGAEITDLAHATPGSLVVMSTHGRSGLGRTFLGSVTDRVVRSSEAPVLVIRAAD